MNDENGLNKTTTKNMNEIPRITASVLIHLKENNAKMCRIGLLRRGLKAGIPIGSFKVLENQTFRKLAESNTNSDFEGTMAGITKLKLAANNQEIEKIQKELECLSKTIGNFRVQMKSMVNKAYYEKWTAHVNDIGHKLTEMFSAENENLFKLAEKEAGSKDLNKAQDSKNKKMENIFHRIYSFANNFTTPYIEDVELKLLFQNDDSNPFETLFTQEIPTPSTTMNDPKTTNESPNESLKENYSNKRKQSNVLCSIKHKLSNEMNEMNVESKEPKKPKMNVESKKPKTKSKMKDEVGNVDLNDFDYLLNEYVNQPNE